MYFISEISFLLKNVYVWEGGLLTVLSWHNDVPKCTKMHFSELQIAKISRGRVPAPPQWERDLPTSYTLPLRAKGAFKALPRLDMLFRRLLQLNLLLLQNLGRTLFPFPLSGRKREQRGSHAKACLTGNGKDCYAGYQSGCMQDDQLLNFRRVR